MKELKRQCPDTDILRVEASRYARVQNQISTASDLSVFSCSYLKLSECLNTTSRVGKIK